MRGKLRGEKTMQSTRKSKLFAIPAVTVFTCASSTSGQFDNVSNWVAFDLGVNGVGNDPDGYLGARLMGGTSTSLRGTTVPNGTGTSCAMTPVASSLTLSLGSRMTRVPMA